MKRHNKVEDAGANTRRETVNISDLMVRQVMMTNPQATVGHVRDVMREHGIHCLPVADNEEHPIGIVTSTDLLGSIWEMVPIRKIMTRDVYTIPEYSRAQDAARMMRNHGIHHLVVTNEKKIVGIVSSFDLLQLVADKRFVMKAQPSRSSRGRGQRKKDERVG